MKKDFQKWHDKKSQVDEIVERPFFHEQEVWFCHLGVNVGFEEDGSGDDFLRPIIVIRKFSNEVFWAIPLSKTEKKNKYYFKFTFNAINISFAILSQIRLIDARRLSYKIGDMSDNDFMLYNRKTQGIITLSFSVFTSILRRSRAEAICTTSIAWVG